MKDVAEKTEDQKAIDGFRKDMETIKVQVSSLDSICSRMENMINKIIDTHSKDMDRVYNDMNKIKIEQRESNKAMGEKLDAIVHRMELSENKIREEIRTLKTEKSGEVTKSETTDNGIPKRSNILRINR
jgi:hypothetical protein